MFIRFVRLKVKEESVADFRTFYEERVIPALDKTKGCLFAGLLEPWRGEEDHRSLTIWESADAVRDYEESGLYHSLLRGAEPMLSDSTSWRVRLVSDPEETADMDRREIPPEGYSVEAGGGEEGLEGAAPSVYVRIVSIRTEEGRVRDFLDIYEEHVLPALREQPGCRGVFLAEGVADENEILSISLWDREEDAVRYEMSGEFERLTYRLEETFSRLRDWRLSLESTAEGEIATPDVEGYHLVAARRL
ncbi:MAG: antibiotic biosynthesis monooxygenase [Thermoanaerobaculia bacterium]|nr:antibiotic biosynthesis monooxygenase [Thermoanaerobaculia bacterium]